MKTCPTCEGGYSDDLTYCLQDGSRLSAAVTFDITKRPTDVFPPQTTVNTDISTAETIVSNSQPIKQPAPTQFQMSVMEPSSRMGCVLKFGQVAAGVLVVFGLGLAGIIYTFRGKSEVASLNSPASNKPTFPTTTANTMANSPLTAANSGTGTGNANKTTPSPSGQNGTKIISGGILNDKAINLPIPTYPATARAVKASGAVSVQVVVDESGNVFSANAVSGHPLLRNAAVQAAYGAKFAPTLQNGKPLKVSGVLTYNFVP